MRKDDEQGTGNRLKMVESMRSFLLAVLMLACGVVLMMTGACSTTSTTVPADNATTATAASPPMPAPSSAPADNPKSVPTSLANAGEYGENIYDYAKAGNWAKAATKLTSLKAAAQQLRSDLKGSSAGEDKLDSNIATLDQAVTAKDRQAAMREANQTTRIIADMTAPLNPPVPIEVTRLDYEGRELEIWSGAKDTTRLKATADEMQRTWETLRPQVESRGGTAVAKRFGDLVARVGTAKTPDECARLAKPILDEVDNLEKVFSKRV